MKSSLLSTYPFLWSFSTTTGMATFRREKLRKLQLPNGTAARLPSKKTCFAVTSRSGLSTLTALAVTLTAARYSTSSPSPSTAGVAHTICPVQAINCCVSSADSVTPSLASLWPRFQRPSSELGASLLGVDQRPMQQRESRGDRFGRGGALHQRRGAHRKGDGHRHDGRHCAGADARSLTSSHRRKTANSLGGLGGERD